MFSSLLKSLLCHIVHAEVLKILAAALETSRLLEFRPRYEAKP